MRNYQDRSDAGQILARAVAAKITPGESVVVLGLPRGGVPVAAAVAKALNATLDVIVARKLGVPFNPEYAFGAIASGGARYLNQSVVHGLALTEDQIAAVSAAETAELQRREQRYRGERPFPNLAGKTVILVDDGIATGATLRAAMLAVREMQPARLIVAAPVAPADTAAEIASKVDEFVCPIIADDFQAVGQFYRDFGQVEDAEVVDALKLAP